VLKLPRTLRLDPSDTFVFERAAEPGEWAVTGSFLFWDEDATALTGKARAQFRAGFVGVESLGFSTLVVVSEASETERQSAILALAGHLRNRLGAPSFDAAHAAAQEEVDFAGSLCGDPVGTVLALHRTFDGGEIRERFRSLHRREPGPAGRDRLHGQARAFEFVETDEVAEEHVDLVGLIKDER
jgi:hypothetical protein